MSENKELSQAITPFVNRLNELQALAVMQYTPVVEQLVREQSRDVQQIEHTLDGLLDFCGYEPALQLYRQLCRYYFTLNPLATVKYVEAYRELWDSEHEPNTENPS